MLGDRFFTYCKCDGDKRFSAWDINEGYPVGNLIYATLVECTDEIKGKLQELADLNKEVGLVVQLRSQSGKIVFETR